MIDNFRTRNLIADSNLLRQKYKILTYGKGAGKAPASSGSRKETDKTQ